MIRLYYPQWAAGAKPPESLKQNLVKLTRIFPTLGVFRTVLYEPSRESRPGKIEGFTVSLHSPNNAPNAAPTISLYGTAVISHRIANA